MKRIIFLLALIAVVATVNAQDFTCNSNTVVAPVQVIDSTVTDTRADTVDILLKLPHNEPWGYSLHVIAANVSGTTDIDVSYQWSNDGTNFVAHTADSLASGNLQYMLEDLTGFGARYMRITWTGVGTNHTKMLGYLYVFKVPGSK